LLYPDAPLSPLQGALGGTLTGVSINNQLMKALADLQGVGGPARPTFFDHTKDEALWRGLAGATATNPAGGNA